MCSLRTCHQALLLVVLLQVAYLCDAKRSPQSGGSKKEAARKMTDMIKSANKDQISKGMRAASVKLEHNVAKGMSPLFSKKHAKNVPPEVREQAKIVVTALKAGELNDALLSVLPGILISVNKTSSPAQQLNTVLGELVPRAPVDLKNPLQGVMDFVRANVNGVNRLLNQTVNGTPGMLNGVVTSLANSLGGVSGAVNGSLDSLNLLVGGLLSNLPNLPLPTGGIGGIGGIVG